MIYNNSSYYFILAIVICSCTLQLSAQCDFTSSQIPIIIIKTNGQEIPNESRIVADMGIINNVEGIENFITNPFNEYDGKINIEIRGSSSLNFDKKQYGFETQNTDGSNNNVSLLGLPVENDWILSAPYCDKSLIRNILAYKLWENLGHYAPRTRLCELFLNEEYMGVYVLVEKIKKDNNRVNISDLNPDHTDGDNLTGGYILKFDHFESDKGWWTGNSMFIQYVYPKYEDIVHEQKTYIKDYVNSFEEKLFSPDFSDSLYGYQQSLDLDAAVDYLIINEVSKNIDAYGLSTYIHKDNDSNGGRLTFGPVWDYNIAFGNADYNDGYKTNGLLAPNNIWWNRFIQDSVFSDRLKTRWEEIREDSFSDLHIIHIIDSLTQILKKPQKRNFQKWNILNKKVWPNYYVGSSYDDEIEFLKSWTINRLNWLDYNLPINKQDYDYFIDYEASIFPNPFNYFFTYVFSLDKASNVTLRLLDSNGKWVTDVIKNSFFEKGKHKIVWNSFIGRKIIPNTYYTLRLEINNRIVSEKKIIKEF